MRGNERGIVKVWDTTLNPGRWPELAQYGAMDWDTHRMA
jgi:hypothetical protein